MSQFNNHKLLNDFYHDEVRLKDEIKHLRTLKKLNLDRLSSGLAYLGKPNFVLNLEQGSIAMHTANKAPDNDYDIDIAVIFEKDDLPASALDARKRVANALIEKATNFTQEPEARTNAVTIWYADGYHVDFAVYRKSKDASGNEVLEHAGASWAERNPKDITTWFTKEVQSQSPVKGDSTNTTVDTGQMRRVVRLIKKFTKGRDGWNLPGGLMISALVSECYVSDDHRDDISLYKTIVSIKDRLDSYCEVYNPTDTSKELTEKQKFLTQVQNLKKRLPTTIKKLNKLFDVKCTEESSRKAWNYLFQNEYFEQNETRSLSSFRLDEQVPKININLSTSRARGGKLTSFNIPDGRILPKNIHLKFEANINIPLPYNIKWTVKNFGDEAETVSDMGHEYITDKNIHWERTSYRGRHFMICEIIQNGIVIAKEKKQVNIR